MWFIRQSSLRNTALQEGLKQHRTCFVIIHKPHTSKFFFKWLSDLTIMLKIPLSNLEALKNEKM